MIPGAPSFALSPANIAGYPHHHPNHPPYQQPRYSLSISIFISMDRRHTLRNHGFASKHYRSFSSLAIFEPKYCNHKIPSRINAFRLIRLGSFSSIANYVSYQVHAFNSRWMIITDRQEHIGCWHGSSALSERSNRGNMPHGQRYSEKPTQTRRL